MTVAHRDFTKRYFLDLLADDALYELKADRTLTGEHQAQLLNYIFLLGLRRGKLLNFRPPKVQGQIVATSLSQEERRRIVAVTDRWNEVTPECSILFQTMRSVLEDWGAFLDIALYQEALIHFLGGTNKVEQRIALTRSELALGTQRMLVHGPGVAFRLTAFTESQESVESHLRRLLALTDLRALQWINLNHAQIQFTSITR